jgi:thiol-disulfide isomerase/thioredoxin
VLVKIPLTVGALLLPGLLLGACTRPAKDHPAGSAPSTALASGEAVPPPSPSAAASASASATTAIAEPSASPTPSSAAAAEAPPVAASGSAYVGCGEPIPLARLWDETTEAEVLDAIASAKACAAKHHRRLLLEFVAPWCADCQEMSKLDETPAVAATLRQRFERVRINVGKWDRHEALLHNFEVRALATYIVIDPKTSKLLAKTTLEPITRKGKKLTAEQWASWLQAH